MANSYLNIPVPTPTQDPVPSAKIQDHVFAGAKLDEAMTSDEHTYTDRLGNKRSTIAGLEKKVDDLEPIKTYYITPEDPDGTIAGLAGTPDGDMFRVAIPDAAGGTVAFNYYKNNGGFAEYVNSQPNKTYVDEVSEIARSTDNRTTGINVAPDVYDEDGRLVGGGFFSKNGISPINYTEDGDANLPGIKIKSLTDDPERLWSADKNNKTFMAGTKLGGLLLGRTEIVEIPGPPGLVFVDKNYIPYACDPSYETDQDIPVIGGSSAPQPPDVNFRSYDYMGVRSEGQSLSLGAGNPADNPQPISTTQKYGNLGFSTNQNSPNTDTDTFVPLVEKRYQPTEGTWPAAETPCTGATHKLVESIEEETGLSFEQQDSIYVASAPGSGGQPLINLVKGTVPYARSLDHTRNSVRLAAAAGRTFAELAMLFRQGESDYRDQTARESYLTILLQYYSDYQSDKKEITGQLFDIILITYQLSTHRAYSRTNPTIALALRDAALMGKSEIAYPGYIGDYYPSDHIHGTPETYFMFSQYEGRMIYKKRKDLIAGITDRIHRLDVIDEVRQGVFTMLYFNVPTPPLVFDVEWVTAAENMGFYIRDKNSYTVVEIITAVEISGPDRVRITTSRPLLESEIVTYGWGKAGDPLTNGRTTGPRGNLRDSEGDLPGESYTDGAGVLRKLHNWCVIF
ncbi:Uncharacterised protein [Serratia ficaria]|uniref:hypothetical protein n=1 Tax=Serratia ficaria TaxID=61651 RepID=UPI0021796C6A|nr:hypothetical protein [Serratia ficaria]CAI2000138.1 Uncharacterised protein [Serratia ficaria]CAI2082052.1 Uncharacterised protein [Serratia ficaria]CAI2491674.1 Uncharacterised protein [Serratia ficaria]